MHDTSATLIQQAENTHQLTCTPFIYIQYLYKRTSYHKYKTQKGRLMHLLLDN